jgi:hypothetical protein
MTTREDAETMRVRETWRPRAAEAGACREADFYVAEHVKQ